MNQLDLYKKWKAFELEDRDLLEEIGAIKDDVDAISDRFYRELEFGTGGLRGVIGVGTNRMNIYTVRKATQAMADYINEEYTAGSVAISYDSRIKSKEFAFAAAEVLTANGIRVFIYKEIMPTPCLSFAVRELNCQGGIMITASHNPSKYNGYKAYGEDGCQMTEIAANKVMELMKSIDYFRGVKKSNFNTALENGEIYFIQDEIIEQYYQRVLEQQQNPGICEKAEIKVVYTPLNGTGNVPVRAVLDKMGVKQVIVVKEQELPDGRFPTCPYPNPEMREALELGLLAAENHRPDVLIATDPDCDRMGIAIPDKNGEYKLLSGNDTGALMLEYICSMRTKNNTMPKNPMTVKTIVTTNLIDKIAKSYNVDLKVVLTGFKYIGEQISLLEQVGNQDNFIFGFEESYGYLAGTHVRDKDAVVSSMLICEMTAYYKSIGMTMLDALDQLYNKYGVHCDVLENYYYEGEQGMNQMVSLMTSLRENPPSEISGYKVVEIFDYKKSVSLDVMTNNSQEIKLPKSDVLCFKLDNGATITIRPSGTEPKIKIYFSTSAKTGQEATEIQKSLSKAFDKIAL